ncbi:MAG TPA: lysophospholipid acyltransferase family protein [Acidobacteriota bacterium]|nr:lysophospholipid acyltransferase family protein [Acidobacteriota bacterium]
MTLTFTERLKIWLFSVLSYGVIQAIGSTLRWQEQGWAQHEAIKAAGKTFIGVFWHGRILPSICWWRDRGIVVMTSQHRDGDYIAAVIRRFGFGSARGSSTRGSRGALVEMLHWLRNGHDVAFTIDGPRGPRYIAKPGAAWLSARSGCPILPYNISAERKWVLRSWDRFQIPKPFSRVVIIVGAPMYVKPGATEEELEAAQRELQRSLEDLLERSDFYWDKRQQAVGSNQ